MIDHDNLEEFQDPANYDLEEGERTTERNAFYRELAREIGGPVLEIACGTGLATIPVAEAGLEVTGVDLARPMIEYARLKAQQRQLAIEWVEADARELALGRLFQFIFLTGNAFQAFLRRPDQERLLASVRQHLAPGGVFAFETRNPSGHDLSDRLEEELWFAYTDVQGRSVRVSGTQQYDPIAQIMHWVTYRRWRESTDEHVKTTRIACRFTYPQELEALLYYNGLRILQQYGNWQKEALTATSGAIITLCAHRLV